VGFWLSCVNDAEMGHIVESATARNIAQHEYKSRDEIYRRVIKSFGEKKICVTFDQHRLFGA
jgi:hypothetical protein